MQKEDLTYLNVRPADCNTRSAKSGIVKPDARQRNVLTYIKNMYRHICYTTYKYVCTYRKKVVPLHRDKKETLTLKPRTYELPSKMHTLHAAPAQPQKVRICALLFELRAMVYRRARRERKRSYRPPRSASRMHVRVIPRP